MKFGHENNIILRKVKLKFALNKRNLNEKTQIIVAIEGIDGAGKTTLINKMCRDFGEKSIVYKRTKKGKFTEKLISSTIMQKYHILQAPIYLILSYKNYILFKLKNKNLKEIVIMDRCFLSNICYFYPQALKNTHFLKVLLFFEVKMFPRKIFILDVDARTGQARDSNRKSLHWLEITKNAYLESINSNLIKQVAIELLPEELTIDKKSDIVTKYIEGERKNGN